MITDADIIKVENERALSNEPIIALYFDDHQKHIDSHKTLLENIDPVEDSKLDKVFYFLKLKTKLDPTEVFRKHIQEHIEILNSQKELFK